MARAYAAIHVGLFDDDDFCALTEAAQRLYLFVLVQPELSYCGVVRYHDRQWAKRSITSTHEGLYDALEELCKTSFLVFDESTDEVWVRSFIKHNKIWQQRHLRSSALSSWERIRSPEIKAAIWEQMLPEDQKSRVQPTLRPKSTRSLDPNPPEVSTQIHPNAGLPSDQRLYVSKDLLEEPIPKHQSSTAGLESAQLDDDDDQNPSSVIAKALSVIADRRVQAQIERGNAPAFPEKYRSAILRGVEQEFTDKASEVLASAPELLPTELADWLLPQPVQLNNADPQPMAPVARIKSRPWCDDCDGTGRLLLDREAYVFDPDELCRSCPPEDVEESLPVLEEAK